MKRYIPVLLSIQILVVFILVGCNSIKVQKGVDTPVKKNVLFILVDDLRPELSIYGQSQMITPNIDNLAKSGVTFNRAYCNVPVCGASRASLLTGKRPTKDRFLTYHSSIKKEMPGVPTIAKYFKNQGYSSISNNKIAHLKNDAPGSWDEEWYPYEKGWRNYITEKNINLEKKGKHGDAFEYPDVDDNTYFDGKTAEKSISDLKKFKKFNTPFFLAVGFVKPHLPFNAPKKYWDLYDIGNIKLPDNATFPETVPQVANHKWGELRYYNEIPKKGKVPEDLAKKLIHGYYASVSYIDAQIGKVIKSLDDLGLRENTVIVLVGDHGWSLSEHGLWAKHSNFEVALRVPLIISSSGMAENKQTESIAELVDLYPTICELSNNPIPSHTDGESLVNVLRKPHKIFKNTALTRWQKGETLIADNYFYTEWQAKGKVTAKMLFDHTMDPDENRNLAVEPSYQTKVDSLSVLLNNKIKNYTELELSRKLNKN